MKEIITLLCAVMLLAAQSSAQNLVTNPSFEKKKYCPSNYNQQNLKEIDSWWQVSQGTPDYFHECSEKAGVPENLFGVQDAQDGVAYAGLVSYSGTKKNYREYLQTKLSRPLASGEMVCVEYHVSTADKSYYVTDGIGFYFTKKKIQQNRNNKYIEARPQIKNLNLNVLDGYGSWVKISDVFVAEGGEEYLTIGNFESDALTAVLQREGVSNEQNPWAYIYIDNIVIKPVKEREECSCTNDIIAQAIADPPLQLQEYHLVEINSVLFDFDESKLLEDAKLRLDSAAALLYRNTSMFLRVIGHTDIVGEAGYNMQLSEKRAQAVIDYLTEKGIDADRLSIDYKGSQDPVASNSDAEGRKQNRRVEFEVLQYDYKWVESPE